jgi:hypothetical protein
VFGVGPLIGSKLFYQWLHLLANAPRRLAGTGVLATADAGRWEAAVLDRANRGILSLLPFPFLLYLFWMVARQCAYVDWLPVGTVAFLAALSYAFVIQAVWWYALMKVYLTSAVFLASAREVLRAARPSVSFYQTALGLWPMYDLTARLLFAYAVVFGYLLGTLGVSLWLEGREASLELRIIAGVIGALLFGLLAFWYSALFGPARAWVAQLRAAELRRIDERIARETDDVARGSLLEQRRRIVVLSRCRVPWRDLVVQVGAGFLASLVWSSVTR